MAELSEEITEPADEPADEPLEEPGPEPDEEEAEDEEAQDEPAPEPEPEQPVGLTEKQLEQGRRKLEAEDTRHRNRVSEIMGEEAQHLVPCPLCSDFIAGLIFPQVPPDDVIERTRVAIGMPDLSNYQQAKHANQCPDCVGLGVVLSGSLIPENAAITCPSCNGSGYQIVAGSSGELVAPALGNGHAQPELPAGVNPDDPAVRELRARGFTVFPPVQIGTPG